jgi:hypothetical protein
LPEAGAPKRIVVAKEGRAMERFETSTPIDEISRVGLAYEPERNAFHLFRSAKKESAERVDFGRPILRSHCRERSHLAARILAEFVKDSRLRGDPMSRSRFALALADQTIADHPDLFSERYDIFAEV